MIDWSVRPFARGCGGARCRPRMPRGSERVLRCAVRPAQAVDDTKGVTVAAASDATMAKGTKVAGAEFAGKTIAGLLVAKGIKEVVFDRGGFRYTGRVKILADAARGAGLNF